MGGVDKSQPAMKITAAGSFFEHLVGWSPHAAANILDDSRLHDDTQHFITSMHNDIDAYSVIVRSTGQIFWFRRSIRMADDTMSPHYVCNFVDAMRNPEFVNTNATNFVISTVDGIKSTMTKSELERATAARKLQEMVGYQPASSVAKMLSEMITTVTAQDLKNAARIDGEGPIRKGIQKRVSPSAPPAVPPPQVVEQQQRLLIDIMFFKQVPFLVGLFDQLDVAVAYFLGPNNGKSAEAIAM